MAVTPAHPIESIQIGDIAIAVQRKPIKHVHLKVCPPDGRVRISAPQHVDLDTLRHLAIAKLPWIQRHQRRLAERSQRLPQQYISGETVFLRGQPYPLQIIPTDTKPQVVLTDRDRVCLCVPAHYDRDQRLAVLRDWYRQHLKADIPAIVERWEPTMGVRVREWRIKRMKTRWGTCNVRAGRIWLNLALAEMPLPCLEYVIVHEMTHLLERSHGERFKRLMDGFLPDWRQRKADLNRHPLTF